MLKKRIIYLAIFCIVTQLSFAQRILNYYPYYRTGTYSQIEFDKMTDVVYAFLNADANGNLVFSNTFNQADFDALVATAKAQNPDIKIHISSGGWQLSSWIYPVASDATKRTNFVKQVADFLVDNDLDGWDLDWEFPSGTLEKDAHEDLLQAMRLEFNERQQLICRHLDVSMAVGGDTSAGGHINYYNTGAINYVDFVSLMAYDDGGSQNHSSYVFAQNAINGYNSALGWSKSKMMLGVPFYGRQANGGAAETFAGIAASDPATAINSDNYGGTYFYNGLPTLEAKTDLIMGEGGLGITIWEVAQDRMGQSYSLLDGLYSYMVANYGSPNSDNAACCQIPDLGEDLSSCGLSFPMTLNSNTPSNTNVLFTWKKLPSTILVNQNASATTLDVNEAGSYVVIRDSVACSQTDTIIISDALPIPELTNTIHLCTPSSVDLVVLNPTSFPSETTWQWYLNGLAIDGATAMNLETVRTAGVYSLLASMSGCASSEAIVNITSDLPNPIDACIPVAGTVDLSVSDEGGNYEWYNAESSGTLLGTGTNFTTPPIASTTTYYVEDASSFATTVGPATTNNGMTGVNDWISPTEMTFDVTTSFTLNGFTIRALIWSGIHEVTVAIRNGNNELIHTESFSLTAVGAAPAFQTVNFATGLYLPTGNNYSMQVTSAVGIGFWDSATFPISAAPYFMITGSNIANRYLAIHDWQIEGGNNCERLPVVAYIGEHCAEEDCIIPTMITPLVISGNVVKISWEAAISAERYRIRYRPIGGTWTEVLTQATETFRFLNNLVPNTSYEYQLKTLCPSANSVWSSTYTTMTDATTCDIPESTTVTTLSSTSVQIDWLADAGDQKYKLKYKPSDNSQPWTEYSSLSTNTKILTSLLEGTEYKYKLKSKCTAAWTNWSSNWNFTTANTFVAKRMENELTIYPTIADQYLHIANAFGVDSYQIWTADGQLVKHGKLNDSSIDLSSLQGGMYIVSFLQNKEIINKRFVKR